jgi:hypothetical protein
MTDQWKNLMVLDHAIRTLEQYDIGPSLSQALYWIGAMFAKNASVNAAGGTKAVEGWVCTWER